MALVPNVKILIKERLEDSKRVYFHVKAPIGTQRSRSVSFKTKTVVYDVNDVIEEIKNNFNIDGLKFIPSESLKVLRYGAAKGVCVFEKTITVDKSKKSVKIVEEKKSKVTLENKSNKSPRTKNKNTVVDSKK